MDKYDEAIEFLKQSDDFSKEVYKAWLVPSESQAGCLFQYVSPNGERQQTKEGDRLCGCLTQVKRGITEAYTPELTKEIRADHRLVYNPWEIKPKDLPVFAEWQRKLDKLWDRK